MTTVPAAAGAGPAPDLIVTVRGHRPAAQGSKRHVGRGRLVEQSRRVAPWRAAVEAAAQAAIAGCGLDGPLDGPLSVEIVFTVRKPASAPKRRLSWPVTRDSGDLDKLLRSTFDALTTSGAIADDSRIVEVTARKVHPGEGLDALAEPGAVIRIWRLS
ncbi:RusA family crossover junction endodeoxyribonuclease [Streptomyces sp. NPDC002537]